MRTHPHTTLGHGDTLRVATYNIHKGVRGVGPRKRAKGAERYAGWEAEAGAASACFCNSASAARQLGMVISSFWRCTGVARRQRGQ